MLMLPLFVIWVVLASAGLFYFGNQHYGTFAPDNHWQNNAPSVFLIEALGIAAAAGKQVVHVQSAKCARNRLVEAHLRQFDEDYKLSADAQFTLQLSQVAAAEFVLPAAPAILIFEDGRLIYAGPYATGPLCSPSDSLIAPILRNEVQLPGRWLNAEAKACRCLINPESFSPAL
tara:strand:+ start:1544 stop:2065 length:522 start_codon:yes stop_codon:yes gene_type:complete